MRRANVSETKNNLSKMLEEVKHGGSILIVDRNLPVARLEPVDPASLPDSEQAARLVRAGLAREPRQQLDIDGFAALRRPKLARGASAVAALLEERDESP